MSIPDVPAMHKGVSLSNAAQQNVETGVWLLCKEFLVTAIQDRRCERGHLRVLASIVKVINKHNAKAWPDRATISAMTGMTVSSVSNSIAELRKWGYLIVDREAVEAAGGRKLTVYTFGNIDHDTIRAEIVKFVERIQEERGKSSPPAVMSSSPPTVKFTAHGDVTSPPTVKNPSPPAENITAHGAQSSPPTVDSNYIEGTPSKKLATQVGADAPAQADLLSQVDPPTPVNVKLWKACVAFKPLGHDKYETIQNHWIERHVPQSDLEVARQFVSAEIEQFFAERPKAKDGTPIRLFGFLTSGFEHRWPGFKKRQTEIARAGSGAVVDDLWADVRRQRMETADE